MTGAPGWVSVGSVLDAEPVGDAVRWHERSVAARKGNVGRQVTGGTICCWKACGTFAGRLHLLDLGDRGRNSEQADAAGRCDGTGGTEGELMPGAGSAAGDGWICHLLASRAMSYRSRSQVGRCRRSSDGDDQYGCWL
ncbi:hypothetical protein ACLOJK_013493 [Asimina triloba]